MADLNVTGTLKTQGYRVAKHKEMVNYLNFDTLYSSNSVSTGNKSITGKFSDYKLLIFGMYNSDSSGYITCSMPTSAFIDLCNLSSMGVWCEQNMSTTNRRVCLVYVNDTTFNVRYINNCTRLRIWGIKNYS